jgi:hypothetical protein
VRCLTHLVPLWAGIRELGAQVVGHDRHHDLRVGHVGIGGGARVYLQITHIASNKIQPTPVHTSIWCKQVTRACTGAFLQQLPGRLLTGQTSPDAA